MLDLSKRNSKNKKRRILSKNKRNWIDGIII